MSPAEAQAFLSAPVVAEEKVDGANLGLSFDAPGRFRAQNRGNFLDGRLTGQWGGLRGWMARHEPALREHLPPGVMLFGEWCFARHSIAYAQLPDWFLGFDVLDAKSDRFWSSERRDALLARAGLCAIRRVAAGRLAAGEVRALLAQDSAYGPVPLEGVYLRREAEGWLQQRTKVVRAEFVQAIGEHWSRGELAANQLALAKA